MNNSEFLDKYQQLQYTIMYDLLKNLCLATEEGDYPNEFYERIGFSTKFTAIGYVKE